MKQVCAVKDSEMVHAVTGLKWKSIWDGIPRFPMDNTGGTYYILWCNFQS